MFETWSEGKAPTYSVQTTHLKPGTVDHASKAWSTYGGRVGVWRIVRMLDRLQIPGTFYTNARCAEEYPDAIRAIDYATMMHVRLTSNSWGGGGYSQAMRDAIHAAGDAGILFVAAAGNDGSNTDIADEFSKLIVTQQAYSANTRIITTGNQMVQELLTMIR